MYIFLEMFSSGETDLVLIAQKAYTTSLKRYHSLIVRGLFLVSEALHGKSTVTLMFPLGMPQIIVRCFPRYDTLLSSLKQGEAISDEQLMTEIRNTLERLKTVLDEINHFYDTRGLDNDDKV